MELIDEISKKLDTISDYMAFAIRADQRFAVGDRVEYSTKAHDRTIARKRSGRFPKGKVIGVDGFSVRVQLDGYKSTSSYHHSFFNPVSGPKLF